MADSARSAVQPETDTSSSTELGHAVSAATPESEVPESEVPESELPESEVPELRSPDYTPVPLTDTLESLDTAIAALADGHGAIAVDTERASGFRYSQRAYLIQMHRSGSGTFLFDPPALIAADPDAFARVHAVIAPEEWVLHAASQDLASLREVGLDPERIFDTELAARLLGVPRVGLGAVVADMLGVRLEKQHSAADWSTRPLPASWLEYAGLDVELLVELRDEIADRLDAAGKRQIAEQEFAATLAKSPKPPLAEPWRRLSGIHAIRSARTLAVARSLWLARDAYAREVDTAPGRLLPDRAILAAAHAQPTDRRSLLATKDFTGRASRPQADRWWAAVAEGLATDSLPSLRAPGGDGMPPPRAWADRNPPADARLKLARAAVQQVGEAMTIPSENLLMPDALRRLAWDPPTDLDTASVGAALAALGARPWQVDATASVIAAAFVTAAQPPSA